MDHLVNVLHVLAIDKTHTVAQKTLYCGTGLGGLNQVYVPTVPFPLSICFIT